MYICPECNLILLCNNDVWVMEEASESQMEQNQRTLNRRIYDEQIVCKHKKG